MLLKRVAPAGVIFPDTDKEKLVEGQVSAVGPGLTDDNWNLRPPGVKAGERVLFGKWAGTEVIIEGEDRLILKESEILGVIEGRARVSAKAT